MLQVLAENAQFDFARMEIFQGRYSNGSVVPLPVSTWDGYVYERAELIYIYHIIASTNPSSGWASGKDSLWFCGWFVDQATGQVYCEEWYRRSGKNANAVMTQDGQLIVYTIGQRQRQNLFLTSSPNFTDLWQLVTDPTTLVDEPYNESTGQSLNQNSKFACVNKEVFYCGEFTDGDIVPLTALVSPIDGYYYSYAECKLIFSWRWTTTGDAYTVPAESNGQLGPMLASIDSTGHVSITVKMIDDSGNVITPAGYGRIAVFAFAVRSATPSSMGGPLVYWDDWSLDTFAPEQALRSTDLFNLHRKFRTALANPEFFGPTTYAHGDTVPLPISPIDNYEYARRECSYLVAWSDTTPASGTHVRVGVFYGGVTQSTGLVDIAVWRLPPGGSFIEDDDTLCRISVLTIGRRNQQLALPSVGSVIGAPSDVSTATVEATADLDAYAITFDMGGGRTTPPGANESLLKHVIASSLTSVTFPAGLTGSKFASRVAATASYTVTIKKNGSTIGTISWASSSTAATLSFSTEQTLSPLDELELVGAATPDATISGIYGTLSGVRNQ